MPVAFLYEPAIKPGDDARLICRKLKRPPVGVVVRRGGCQHRFHPRHMSMVQNYEVRPQKLLSSWTENR
ncbi:hypothetical protein TNCV_4611701 [Trichonephila clavipes]|nr:hypothetical protein TNCV_4611701 [Trichonephila clavipes]